MFVNHPVSSEADCRFLCVRLFEQTLTECALSDGFRRQNLVAVIHYKRWRKFALEVVCSVSSNIPQKSLDSTMSIGMYQEKHPKYVRTSSNCVQN